MSRQDYFRTYEATRGPRDRTDYARSYGRARRAAAKAKPKTCIGLDGEGFESGSCYAYLAAWSKAGEIDSVENLRGLPTFQCLDFLLGLPAEPLKFGFSLGYDYTHWLKDLGNKELYALNHVEMRQAKKGPPRPVLYRHPLVEGQYALNLLSSRLSVTKLEGHKGECEDMRCPGCRPRHRVVVWDVFKFFQSSFIAACLAWGVITEAEFEVLDRMKKERPNFRRPKASDDPAWVEIKNYCGLECGKMADLAERLLQAHDDAGLQLKSYYGAGSTGAAMLEKMGVRRFIHVNKKRIEHTPEVRSALAHAFFGGRFEILHYGSIPEDLFSYDISSAYPYAFTFLPCLAHGAWERVAGRNALAEIERADGALVRYRLPWVSALGKNERDAEGRLRASRTPWGPFPFRDGDGNILFPVTSGGGWVHKTEFLAALAAYPNVELVEAWIYKVQCSCEVLRQLMPENYKLRLRWGKEGKGIVSKLGQNSCYGKAAQTKGANPPYQSFMWAGMTTASCRAQVTRAMARDFEGIVMIATDGIVSRRRLALDGPRDTGTFDAVNVLSNAIKAANSTDPGKIREAILATRKFPGAEGEYNFDQNGDGLRGYNIVRNESGNVVFDKHIEFTD